MSTTTHNGPDWLTVGAKVAIVGGGFDLSVAEVERLTKTQAVVNVGANRPVERFRLDGADRRPYKRGSGSWTPTRYLAPLSDPDVQRGIEEAKRIRAARQIEALAIAWRRAGDPPTTRGEHSPRDERIAAARADLIEAIRKSGLLDELTREART